MTSSMTSVEHSPRRRPSLDTVSDVERAVAAGLVAIIGLIQRITLKRMGMAA